MKRILILIALLPLLLSVTTVQATEVTQGGVTIQSTITTDMPLLGLVSPNAVCKSQSHKLTFKKGDTVVAWTKLTGSNACWSACGVKLGNSSRSHDAVSGWWWKWGVGLLGGRPCGSSTIVKYTNDDLHGPGGIGYLTRQQMRLVWTEPLDYNWSYWSTPVVWP